jgi:hypothetical protein
MNGATSYAHDGNLSFVCCVWGTLASSRWPQRSEQDTARSFTLNLGGTWAGLSEVVERPRRVDRDRDWLADNRVRSGISTI